jgi:hypothetical protein
MNLDRDVARKHRQLHELSCAPMAAELVLKLIKRAPENYFDLQEEREKVMEMTGTDILTYTE